MVTKIEMKDKKGVVIMTLTKSEYGYDYTNYTKEIILDCRVERTKKGFWVYVYLIGLGTHKFFISNIDVVVTE